MITVHQLARRHDDAAVDDPTRSTAGVDEEIRDVGILAKAQALIGNLSNTCVHHTWDEGDTSNWRTGVASQEGTRLNYKIIGMSLVYRSSISWLMP